VKNDPADVQGYGQRHQAYAQHDEKRDLRSATREMHDGFF
jgi:hypothetical protein